MPHENVMRLIEKITEVAVNLAVLFFLVTIVVWLWLLIFAAISQGAQARELSPHQMDCLTQAVYWEARGEPIEGQLEVAHVVLNRVRDERFPNTACAVVQQRLQGACQFAWACTYRRHVKVGRNSAWQQAREVAMVAARQNQGREPGVLYFRARRTQADTWWRGLFEVAEIGGHTFYAD